MPLRLSFDPALFLSGGGGARRAPPSILITHSTSKKVGADRRAVRTIGGNLRTKTGRPEVHPYLPEACFDALSALPGKLADEPVDVASGHLKLDFPTQPVDVLGQLERHAEARGKCRDLPGTTLPKPAAQAHRDGSDGGWRDFIGSRVQGFGPPLQRKTRQPRFRFKKLFAPANVPELGPRRRHEFPVFFRVFRGFHGNFHRP